MKGIIDTHTFLWWADSPSQLSPTALAFLSNSTNTVLLSVVSVWEIIIKKNLGKLTLRTPLRTMITEQQGNGLQLLPVSLDHVLEVENLPLVHKDPFDRLLAAQANVEGAVLVTADLIFSQYPVRILG